MSIYSNEVKKASAFYRAIHLYPKKQSLLYSPSSCPPNAQLIITSYLASRLCPYLVKAPFFCRSNHVSPPNSNPYDKNKIRRLKRNRQKKRKIGGEGPTGKRTRKEKKWTKSRGKKKEGGAKQTMPGKT
jgi:hypothetical protein